MYLRTIMKQLGILHSTYKPWQVERLHRPGKDMHVQPIASLSEAAIGRSTPVAGSRPIDSTTMYTHPASNGVQDCLRSCIKFPTSPHVPWITSSGSINANMVEVLAEQ